MKTIDNHTFYKYSFLSGVKSNKKGNKAVFVRHTPHKERNTYDSNIYLYDSKVVTKLTSCDSVGEVFWQDDNTVVFVSNRGKKIQSKSEMSNDASHENAKDRKSENKITLYKKRVNSCAESEHFVTLDGKARAFNFCSEHHLMYIKSRELKAQDSDYFAAQQNRDGFMRIRKSPFYMDGGSYNFNQHSVLCIHDVDTNQATEIVCEGYSVRDYKLASDKSAVLIIAQKLQKQTSLYDALFEYDFNAGKITKLLDDDSKQDAYSIASAMYFNGRPCFWGTTMKTHGINENSLPYEIKKDGTVRALCLNDINYFNSSVQDMELAAGYMYKICGDYITFITTDGTVNKISGLSKEGKYHDDVLKFDGGISCFDYLEDQPLFVGVSPRRGQELYLGGQRVTDFHDFLDDYYVAKMHPITINSTGVDIDGFVLLPENYDQNDASPAVLNIHGGPKATYQYTYFHEMQMLANQGYVVMYCNPRGSSGKGNDFANIFGEYGTRDYQNIMNFVDAVLKKYNKIDHQRLFVTGGSYGGYMTNHIITQTNRFKAAVTQRCICNWISFYGTSDIGYFFVTDQHKTDIAKDSFWQDLWDVSPLKNISKVKTPTLIIHSDADYRCPLEQGYQMFNALIDRGVDTELLVFKGENHGLSREGKPNNRFERLEAIKNWFAKYDV